MRPNPYLMQGFKYAAVTLLILVLAVAGVAIYNNTKSSNLTGRLVSPQQQGIVPTVRYEAARAINGFSLPADTHVLFTVPEGVARLPRITFFGGPDTDLLRYWGYCYSGHEPANKAAGKIGKEMYDGRFFYSTGEREAQLARPNPADTDIQGILENSNLKTPEAKASIAEIFSGGDTCYVMSSAILPVAIDSDSDGLNNARERMIGTDPNNPDTDGDGISDGQEVFVTKTNPLDPDTDHDGLTDGCEDANQNGQVDKGETSALNPDTDRDGLCDGGGYAGGCPEPRKKQCQAGSGGLICSMVMASPVYGEDVNQNCKADKGETNPVNPETYGIPDWEWKYQQLSDQTGNRVGTPAPEFPIPNLPPHH
jgi:hypothetical protein